ncbi:MAG: T9SS type A sorting domain-containing protein, partial [Flavobacteriales bacterium]|nr:T9SS type A sorting domain-containing protein [Flavobacteriales bacterium]
HGRGIFRTETLLGVGGPSEGGSNANSPLFSGITIFPNPATDVSNVSFVLRERTEVTASVYDVNGRLVSVVARQNLPKGEQRLQLPVQSLANGTYLLELRAGDARQMGRFIVNR